MDYKQKRANRQLVRVAIETAVRIQTAAQVDHEARRLQAWEVAFRRLVLAEQKEKGHQNERKKQGKKGKSEKSETKKEGDMIQTKRRSNKESNASLMSYEKKSDVIRVWEPKIPL